MTRTLRALLLAPLFVLPTADAAPLPESRLENFDGSKWRTYGGTWTTNGGVVLVTGGEGAKAAIAGLEAGDFQLDVELLAKTEGTQAGVVFRATDFGEGIDAFRGQYVGITAGRNLVLWGAVDPTWRPIASRPFEVKPDTWHHLRIRAVGSNVRIYVDEKPITGESWPVFDGVEPAFTTGGVALRSLDGAASFRNLRIEKAETDLPAETYTNPVQAGCADPVVLQHRGKYYAYTTHTPDHPRMVRGIRLHTSDNLVDWTDQGFVLKNEDSWGDSRFWAPDIVEKDGTFYLYYAADERMCVATASSPMGPFRQETRAPIEPDSIRIDGHVFQDDDGQRYFYYVTFNDGNQIWGSKLNDDMVSVDSASLRLMVKPDQPWERHRWAVTEGAEMLKHNSTYYLTYSGSHFESPEYAVGYATSASPLGPWKKHAFNPVMKTTAYAHGTAHHCFTKSPDGTETFIVYHRHSTLTETEPRALSIDRVRFIPDPNGGPDILQIHGPTSSPQPMPSGAKPTTR